MRTLLPGPPGAAPPAAFTHPSSARPLHGFTLLELLVVLVILAVVFGISAHALRGFNNPVLFSASQTGAFVRSVRGKAISTTSAVRVRAESPTTLVAERASSCASTAWEADPSLRLTLTGAVLDGVAVNGQTQSWTTTVCFDARGLADQNVIVTFKAGSKLARLEVMLGGATRLL